jgi:dTDP-glucose 4,6-dehydratase
MYDEAKRFAEALAVSFEREFSTSVRIARIFNTHGPRMQRRDGRAVPNFVDQALRGEPLTVHGDGSQTRSLCYVDDLIEGFWCLINSDLRGPVNLGTSDEIKILELARLVNDVVGNGADVVFVDRPVDDPSVRCPDLSRAIGSLNWKPRVPLEEGLRRTVEWARRTWMDTPPGD